MMVPEIDAKWEQGHSDKEKFSRRRYVAKNIGRFAFTVTRLKADLLNPAGQKTGEAINEPLDIRIVPRAERKISLDWESGLGGPWYAQVTVVDAAGNPHDIGL